VNDVIVDGLLQVVTFYFLSNIHFYNSNSKFSANY